MTEVKMEAQKRQAMGKNANRRLRSSGFIPAVIYGGKGDSVPVQVDRTGILEVLRSESGENTICLLKLAGTKQSSHTMIKELQTHPLDGRILHVDFQRIEMSEKISVRIPLELDGTAAGVKNEGGVLDFVTREIEVECLPGAIPESITLDVSGLHIGDTVEAGALRLPEGVALVEDPERVLVSVYMPTVTEEEVEEEEALLEAEAEEPEVIRRGRSEEEEEEGEEA